MKKELKELLNKKNMLLLITVLIIIVVLMVSFFALSHKEPGVYREISQKKVTQGEAFKLKLDVIAEGKERYYLVEERIPEEFEIINYESSDNKIKLYEIGVPMEDNTYEYELVPLKTGTYYFDGEYALDGHETSEIKGNNKIVVVEK